MRLDKEFIRVIARGAFLHDIGILAVADAILRKPTALTGAETAAMREHCVRGYQLLRKIPFLVDSAEIVYSHHEFYDGTGYPRGLKGDNIPLGSRIFAVADALDAITSQRPYRTERPIEVAKTEIERWRRRQFDPNLVDVFLRMPESIWVDLRREIGRQGEVFGTY
jgi:HD-GYP domain-containing protein (c-di-GMP phosphodiesterase class II)